MLDIIHSVKHQKQILTTLYISNIEATFVVTLCGLNIDK